MAADEAFLLGERRHTPFLLPLNGELCVPHSAPATATIATPTSPHPSPTLTLSHFGPAPLYPIPPFSTPPHPPPPS